MLKKVGQELMEVDQEVRGEPLRLPEIEELEIIIRRKPDVTKQENAAISR